MQQQQEAAPLPCPVGVAEGEKETPSTAERDLPLAHEKPEEPKTANTTVQTSGIKVQKGKKHFFEAWKLQRAAERKALKQKEKNPAKVPFKLSSDIQLWVPVELIRVVQNLWEQASFSLEKDLPAPTGVQDPDFDYAHFRVLGAFLSAVYEAKTEADAFATKSRLAISPASRTYLLRLAFSKFHSSLKGNNIHAIPNQTSNETKSILRVYLAVSTELRESGYPEEASNPSISALLEKSRSGEVGLMAVFGGQGVSWLPELCDIYQQYSDLRPVVEAAILSVQELAKGVPHLFPQGLDILSWMLAFRRRAQQPSDEADEGASLPPPEYLSYAPISYPMLGLVSLANYLLVIKAWGLPVEEVVKLFRGVTGHSQGITPAVVFASARTEEHLIASMLAATKLMFWLGVRLQQVSWVPSSVPTQRADLIAESIKSGDSIKGPTPMLAIFQLLPSVVQGFVDRINKSIADKPERQLEIALVNGPRAVVVVGHPESLHSLATLLRNTCVRQQDGLDQSRIPYSRRKKEYSLLYLSVSVPFHSNHLQEAVPLVLADAERLGIVDFFSTEKLLIPVYSPATGEDLRSSKNLLSDLITLQCVEHVHWPKAMLAASVENGVTHVIDWGPGGPSGIGSVCKRNLEGSGVQIIFAATEKNVLLDCRSTAIPFAPNWKLEYAPRITRRACDNCLIVDTLFSRLIGKPPIVVAGMTPTTVNHEIVAAALNAGYYAELAGGGLPREASFRTKVQQLVGMLGPGHGITFNLLFLNPRLWSFQYPLIIKLANEGVPVDGVTIAAGVPSLEKSVEILNALQSAGVRYVAFKPGSVAAIQLVTEIAGNVPTMPILLQWTGGRGGGHHSFEDFHEPILQTYAAIRSHRNIVLIAGSGFGDAKDSWPYMTGEWSKKYGVSAMPFDAILISSRIMVCKEAATAIEAKKLLVDTPGVSVDSQWEESYDGIAGGIMTVTSELGEPIHKVATRGVKLWRELDQQIFSLPRDKQAARIAEKKEYIIARLNADFQKVFFGRKPDGRVVDLPDMTYSDVAERMVQLMYLPGDNCSKEKVQEKVDTNDSQQKPNGRWIHGSYLDRVHRFLKLLEERFVGGSSKLTLADEGTVEKTHPGVGLQSRLPSRAELQIDPSGALARLFEIYPQARTQLLASEDVDTFLQICRQKGKPVNFVPVIDEDLQFWFKKDSLWQSEDLAAVEGRDVGRVVILQGPLAVRYSTKVNEPVADVLNGIHNGWVSYLLEGEAKISTIEYLGDVAKYFTSFERNDTAQILPLRRDQIPFVRVTEDSVGDKKKQRTISVDPRADRKILAASLDGAQWTSLLCLGDDWWRALLTTSHITRGRRRLPNQLKQLFTFRPGQTIHIIYSNHTDAHTVEEVRLLLSSHPGNQVAQSDMKTDSESKEQLEHGESVDSKEILHLVLESGNKLCLALHHYLSGVRRESLLLHFAYHPEQGWSPIHEISQGLYSRLRAFYSSLWLPSGAPSATASGDGVLERNQNLPSTHFRHTHVISRSEILHFCQAVGRPIHFPVRSEALLTAPVDYAIVISWESLIKPLFFEGLGGDLLQLLHLSNGFRWLGKPVIFKEGDHVETDVEVIGVDDLPSGRRVSVKAILRVSKPAAGDKETKTNKENTEVATTEQQEGLEVTSHFLFRASDDEELSHSSIPLVPFRKHGAEWVLPMNTHNFAILRSKPWIQWLDTTLLGNELTDSTRALLVRVSATEITQQNDTQSIRSYSVSVSGEITHNNTRIADIKYHAKGVKANIPFLLFQRLGKPKEEACFFPQGGYSLLATPDVVSSPEENHTYAFASRDFNPIHTNPLFATLASLPSTITHGMWSSANARRVIESYIANDLVERVLDFSTEFIGMVLPRDRLTTQVKHVGMRNGRMLLEISTRNQEERLVLKGKAEVTSPRTVFVFTGQGSASVGMGMDLYASSQVAKNVWDIADTYFLDNFGFSIINIVKENPKHLTLYFGGIKGRQIKSNYQAIKQRVRLSNGDMVERPLFLEIKDSSSTFTFSHPDGLLFATQFSQPALVLVALAAFRDMKEKGLVPEDCIFAGHSLGEYAALASVASVMSIESLVDIVFLRGMTMQNAVDRKKGRSNYGMVAVNPSRVHPTLFREAHLHQLIDEILKQRSELLQVVNYNIENNQYVVAGELGNLNVLGLVLSELKKDPKKAQNVAPLIASAILTTEENRLQNDGLVQLTRGEATIPLPGIDVPFHSKFLADGVPAFRQVLQQRMTVNSIDPAILVGRYIPNVTAQPFSLSESYVKSVFERTQSEILGDVLQNFASYAANPQRLAHLLLIELLAYQFASPVRWIETQHVLFSSNGFAVERFIEIGPAPTLVTMAQRTLSSGNYSPLISRQVLWYVRDRDAIYYSRSDSDAEETTSVKETVTLQEAPRPVVNHPPAPVAPHPPAITATIPDAPVDGLQFLRVLLAIRLKQKLEGISPEATLKQLAGGKSALQNEVVGDMEKEFGCKAEDNMADLPLKVLAVKAGSSYNKLGDVSNSLISKMISRKMPGGFSLSSVRAYLSSRCSLPEGRVQGVLLHSLTMEPLDRLASEGEATKWLDSVVVAYSSAVGITMPLVPTGSTPVAAAPVTANVGVAPSITDEGPTALDALVTVLSGKLKTPRSNVGAATKIRDLVGGKSALQNEVVGDLSKEFGKPLETEAADLPLSELALKLQGGYSGPGPYLQAQLAKLVNSTMPGGFPLSAMKAHLAQFGLPAGRIEAVLLWALSHNHVPSSRFPSDSEAKRWLDSVTADYVATKGLTLGATSTSSGGAATPIDTTALNKYEERVNTLAREQAAALQRYLGDDPLSPIVELQEQGLVLKKLQKEIDFLREELGEFFLDSIRPMFDPKKERRYNSSWNWTRQDCLLLYYDYACGRAQEWNRDIRERLYRIKNRVTSTTVEMCEYYKKKALDDGHGEIVPFITILADTLRKVLEDPPVYRELTVPLAPMVSVSDAGSLIYKEVPREGVKDMTEYVRQLTSTLPSPRSLPFDLPSLVSQLESLGVSGEILLNLKANLSGVAPSPKVDLDIAPKAPFVFLRHTGPEDSSINEQLTWEYMRVMQSVATEGLSFAGKIALVTGCGPDSIGLELVKSLLRGGARVYATTSRFSREGAAMYHSLFDQHGTRGSQLVVFPFNQASALDVAALVEHIYTIEGVDIDILIPFAAISETGRDIGNIDSRSELAHRIMLTNLIRLIGAVKNAKERRGITTRPAHVILPLSPNHGIFGYDGLYAESKLGLHSLTHKWRSEAWRPYLSIAGAIIGWTRGTGLMSTNNIVASGIERLGVRTFSSLEICFNITALLHPRIVALSQNNPILADLNGGLHALEDLNEVLGKIRKQLQAEAALKKVVSSDALLDDKFSVAAEKAAEVQTIRPRANVGVAFPPLPSAERHRALREKLGGMVDLESVVVIVGFGEIGPYGNARTRWEMEAYGAFSLEGTIELAWMMGLIKYEKAISPEKSVDGVASCGWVDSKTGEHVPDHQIKARYEKTILAHTGIRFIEPELFDGYDPKNKTFFQQVALNQDMEPMEVSQEEAVHFKRKHQQYVDVWHNEDGLYFVRLKKGAVLYVPKALNFNRFVAGQVPTSWDPAVLGIPHDIIQQVDRVTLFTLVSTVEALVSAGITDPYEFYKYVHVSEVGNTIGGGFGGMQSVRKTHLDTLLEKPVPGDVLQEQFINTAAAWVNMLLLSSSGPIKTPVGACATAVESLEVGVDTILSGKAKVVVIGGYDDFGEEGSYGFAQMNATSNSAEEVAAGRDPLEMSRPATSTRSGFMEAHGAGVEILMTAQLAIEMGVPIYGVVAHVATATDKEGRSVPAPGQGILVTAREKTTKHMSPLLDLAYRREQLKQELATIHEWQERETDRLLATHGHSSAEEEHEKGTLREDEDEIEQLVGMVEQQAQKKAKAAYSVWGGAFYVGNAEISPLRGALAVWGLHPDDIAVASMHGTGTHANDINECFILQKQLAHLGRSKGNVVIPIFQKYLTGHPKGAAAAWMLNGVLQSMMTGIVPGNRNADNIDPDLHDCDKLVFLNRTVATYGYKAALLKSFGFGQVGGEVLIIHPDYVLSQLSSEQLESYNQRRLARHHQAYRHIHDSLTRKRTFVQVKTQPPYQGEDEEKVYLDPTARAQYSAPDSTWLFPHGKRLPKPAKESAANSAEEPRRRPSLQRSLSGSTLTNLEVALREMGEYNRTAADRGIGVDVQLISEIDVSVSNSEEFVHRNFTEAEIEYCRSAADPAASFAGRWAAKEAVVKAITSCDVDERGRKLWEGASGALREIEVLRSASGAPRVHLKGHTKEVAILLGISSVTVTISHSGEYAVAQAVAK